MVRDVTGPDLLPRMSALLQFRTPDGLWHARALGCTAYGHGETPDEAMTAALCAGAWESAPRRRVVVSEDAAPRRRPVQGGFFDKD